jgi:hypothetical protein
MKNLVILALTIVLPMLVQAHEHIYVIANSQTQGTPLSFLNGAGYSTNSSYVFPLTLASNGTYADKYEFGGVTFASFGIFNFNSPAPGTQVRLRLVAVTGPPGGSFGVWDVDGINPDELDSTTLTFSLLVGTTNGTNSILISENNGEPGADPYGHIHGRHYTATTPGLYVVTVQAYDGSSNGTGGDPIHTVSAPLQIYFQAGDLIDSVTSAAAQVNLGFAAKLGTDYYVEATTNLSPATNWETIAGPFTGDSHLQTVTDSDVSVPEKFYRLRLKPTP